MSDINWYPGHMARGMRFIKENIKNVDVILTLTDARAPLSTLNKELYKFSNNKPFIVIINKSDLVDKNSLNFWIEYFKNKNKYVKPFSCTKPQLKNIFNVLDEISIFKKKSHAELKIMVTGIANVGKSSFINLLFKKAKLKTGKKAGLTRGVQWVKIAGKYAFLDTPGIVMKKMKSEKQGMILASIGTINDNILDMETIFEYFKNNFINEKINEHICNVLKVNKLELEDIAIKRGYLNSNRTPDKSKAATAFIKLFREGKLGKFLIDSIEK